MEISVNMFSVFQRLVVSSSLITGATLGVVVPSWAVNFSVTGSDNIYFESFTDTDGQQKTREIAAADAVLPTILSGDITAPGGNLELSGNATESSLQNFQSLTPGTVTADFSTSSLTFSALGYSDWFETVAGTIDTSYGADNFANQWFGDLFGRYETEIRSAGTSTFGIFANIVDASAYFNLFQSLNGFGRFSDPNLSYANATDNTIEFGLAGHSDAGNIASFLSGMYASEVIKVAIDGGGFTNFYSFDQPTDSGQYEISDGTSHDATFAFSIPHLVSSDNDEGPVAVPEPSMLLVGLATFGGMLLKVRQKHGSR